MRKDKQKALFLRKTGKSYKQIERELGIPKSTLSDWLRNEKWSNQIKQRLSQDRAVFGKMRLTELGKIRGRHLAKLYEKARIEATRELNYFKWHPLFIAGIAIYWGEGGKTIRGSVSVSNSDPLLIRTYVSFLKLICNVPPKKIKAHLLLYPDLDVAECHRIWTKNTGLRASNFTKPVIIQGRHKTRRLAYVVCNIDVSSTYLKEKILVWLRILPQELHK
jgi:transposase-like protein